MTRAWRRWAPRDWARERRKESSTSRRSMGMYSSGLRVFAPKSTVRLEGEMIFILVTWRSMRWRGIENSSSMHRGMAPPHGLAVEGLRSKRKVSTPPAARASAAEDPAGPPPITAARSLRPGRGALAVMARQARRGLCDFLVKRGEKKVAAWE